MTTPGPRIVTFGKSGLTPVDESIPVRQKPEDVEADKYATLEEQHDPEAEREQRWREAQTVE